MCVDNTLHCLYVWKHCPAWMLDIQDCLLGVFDIHTEDMDMLGIPINIMDYKNHPQTVGDF